MPLLVCFFDKGTHWQILDGYRDQDGLTGLVVLLGKAMA